MKRYSLKFWIVFWLASVVFLTGWFFFWQIRNRDFSVVEKAMEFLPLDADSREEWKTLVAFGEYGLQKDGKERTFLILFQNNMEIRPGGGFIGAFGILKVKDGSITLLQTHDLSNFDARIPDGIPTPYPMLETLRVKDWKLRDSNWSPDFAVNARKAEEFYYLGKGEEQFDGVIGITTNVLTSFLKVTGPVRLEGYPGEYGDENAVLSLEYQVEKGFDEQGVARGDRKLVMTELAEAIIQRVFALSNAQKVQLAKIILEDLEKKDIQLYFHDERLQAQARSAGWNGEIDQAWEGNYLAVSDANLGAYKSDYYVKRNVDYAVDWSKADPEGILKITYKHTAQQKDWMTKDYVDFVRVYLPEGAWLRNENDFGRVVFGEELGKKYFGTLIHVPLASERTFQFRFSLPGGLADKNIKIQKQAGMNGVPYAVHVVSKAGVREDYEITLDSDIILGNKD